LHGGRTAELQDLTVALADRYSIERELGHGSSAVVYLAHDRKHGRKVAVKVLKSELVQIIGAERFLREIAIMANFTHPHILPLLDSGQVNGLLYYVMPYVEGESLRERLVHDKQLPVEEALQVACDVAEALTYAHAHGVVHRDIKPENILLQAGQAIVTDFGIARAVSVATGQTLTGTGIAVGTPTYMSPEQGAGSRQVDGRSDVYSLGCVLYEMLVGHPPFIGATVRETLALHSADPIPRLRAVRTDVPAHVGRAVDKALAKQPGDRFGTAKQFIDAVRPANRGEPWFRAARAPRIAWPVGAIVLAILGAVALRSKTNEGLDPNLLVVAPFDVLDRKLDLWREGMVDVLSGALDGTGPLRTVSPSVAIRQWRGPADRASATTMARVTGARLAVFGQLMPSDPDSVRARVSVLDVSHNALVGEVEVRQLGSRMDLLADSITVAVLHTLGRLGPQGTGRLSSLGTHSLPALKAFLQGEHHLRRTQWDSAAVAYRAAIALDNSFALAYWRLKNAVIGQAWGIPDSVGDGYVMRAARRNHGLAPRESLLITVDSLWASLNDVDGAIWSRTRRLFATLDETVRRYPTDPFVWFKIGEARFHLAPPLDFTNEQTLDAFDRAIALDSSMAQAYLVHPIQLAVIVDGTERARRYAEGYLRFAAVGVEDSAVQLADRLLDPRRASTSETDDFVHTASTGVLYRATATLGMWFDSAETALRLARAMVRAKPAPAPFDDSLALRRRLARVLALRGHLREAYAQILPQVQSGIPADETVDLFTDLCLLGAVPSSVARATFDRWWTLSPRATVFGLHWWAAQGDTAVLRRAHRSLDSLARTDATPQRAQLGEYGAAAASAYHALSSGDTLTAITRLLSLPDSFCQDCYLDWVARAHLLARRGRLSEARRYLRRVTAYAWHLPTYPRATLQLGSVDERLREPVEAERAYRATATAWEHADLSLRGFVDQAHRALNRLRAGHP